MLLLSDTCLWYEILKIEIFSFYFFIKDADILGVGDCCCFDDDRIDEGGIVDEVDPFDVDEGVGCVDEM